MSAEVPEMLAGLEFRESPTVANVRLLLYKLPRAVLVRLAAEALLPRIAEEYAHRCARNGEMVRRGSRWTPRPGEGVRWRARSPRGARVATRGARVATNTGTPCAHVPHGTANGYNHFRCRCDECRATNAARQAVARLDRAARLAADPSLVEHGKASTYSNWDCRCAACCAANSAKCGAYAARARREMAS